MRHFVVAALGVFTLASAAPAALIIRVDDVVVSPSDRTATVNVRLAEQTGDFFVSAFNVGVQTTPRSGVTIAEFGAASEPLMSDANLFNYTANVSGYNTSYDLALSNFRATGASAVENGASDGLFSITYNIPVGTTGTYLLTVDPNELQVTDGGGQVITFTPDRIESGSITVVPEPSAIALGLFALPLLARRRRH